VVENAGMYRSLGTRSRGCRGANWQSYKHHDPNIDGSGLVRPQDEGFARKIARDYKTPYLYGTRFGLSMKRAAVGARDKQARAQYRLQSEARCVLIRPDGATV
jgi:hypothetical protein